MTKAAFYTLGCKLNQAETAMLAQLFTDKGYDIAPFDTEADVYVLNTCTVTERSAAKCRKLIRKVIREQPEAVLIVAGCYSQVSHDEIIDIPGVDYVFGSAEKLSLFEYAGTFTKQKTPAVFVTKRDSITQAKTGNARFIDNTRAFLKIQDGCDNFCSYCIVPYARGPARSVPLETVVQRAESLTASGYKELVLTGVHIGKWQDSRNPDHSLAYLLKSLLQIDFDGRIRLGSIEPEELTDRLLDVVSGDERVCRQFHISLQSGCDSVLERMKRHYSAELMRDRIDALVNRFNNPGIGCDVIAGFPGETAGEFEETRSFIDQQPFTYMHVFPYSLRSGTAAAKLPGQVKAAVKKERAKILRDMGMEKKKAFSASWTGRTVKVLFEKKENGNMSGFSPEYVRVYAPLDQNRINTITPVQITEVFLDGVYGTMP